MMLLLDRLHVASKVLQIVCQHLLSLTVGVTVVILTQLEVVLESIQHLQFPDADLAALAPRRLIGSILDHDLVREAALGRDAVLTALLTAELAPVQQLRVFLLEQEATDPATVALALPCISDVLIHWRELVRHASGRFFVDAEDWIPRIELIRLVVDLNLTKVFDQVRHLVVVVSPDVVEPEALIKVHTDIAFGVIRRRHVRFSLLQSGRRLKRELAGHRRRDS